MKSIEPAAVIYFFPEHLIKVQQTRGKTSRLKRAQPPILSIKRVCIRDHILLVNAPVKKQVFYDNSIKNILIDSLCLIYRFYGEIFCNNSDCILRMYLHEETIGTNLEMLVIKCTFQSFNELWFLTGLSCQYRAMLRTITIANVTVIFCLEGLET